MTCRKLIGKTIHLVEATTQTWEGILSMSDGLLSDMVEDVRRMELEINVA